jgi:hypothetical protein
MYAIDRDSKLLCLLECLVVLDGLTLDMLETGDKKGSFGSRTAISEKIMLVGKVLQ